MHPSDFYKSLINSGIKFFTGVPDSLLKDFCAYLGHAHSAENHVIAANEGTALSIAAGWHLGSNTVPLVYLQNSGLGNLVNPLVSLADPAVYGIPIVLLIGWRGEEGVPDEPQHVKQGQITRTMLETIGIPYKILEKEMDNENFIRSLIELAIRRSGPVAILVKKGVFSPFYDESLATKKEEYELTREEAIKIIAKNTDKNTIIVTTTGYASRELFEYRKNTGEMDKPDFLTVGSMGHASQIALGIALSRKERKVICLDGDGSALMHMGGLATIASLKPKNLIYILLNNGMHESVGGQPTVAQDVSFSGIACACGFNSTGEPLLLKSELEFELKQGLNTGNPSFIEILIKSGTRSDLGRPDKTPVENKTKLMQFLNKDDAVT